ncbi:NADP-dependent oxidoreductase domain-containing protein [Kockovaella imperatae]|uniref:NADP-dependent oxidoreductase domain-containing protein n=1 Tax=Kockovaella imperatae TaxID=4999 RepID=A0A1Y1U9Q2_9TREE|nr:NADP-dependent oxidoreductase domain-containing protein [Kockovaella imperatae]ORX34237.1 NADP-dependent oxidoreductase domain-containing protein [Kockovaella imperatae]
MSATQHKKPRIILGLMTFGPDKEKGARVTSMDDFNKILDDLQKLGYNEVDTAYSYCGTEQQAWTRKANWKERDLKLATKFYPGGQGGGHDAANIRAKLEWNLEQLGTDCVDIFYLHAADRNTPFVETLEECNKLHKEGKFKQLGISNFTAYELAECVTICQERGWVKPSIYQGMYNAITRNLESELIVACHRYGLEIVVYNPLAGGLFSGKIKSKDQKVEDPHSRFGAQASTGSNYRKRYFRDATFESLEIIEKVADKHNLTLLEIALRWTVHHSKLHIDNGKDGIIIGVSSVDQLESNIKDLEKGPLPEEVVQVIDEAWLHVKAVSPVYWHGELEYGYDWDNTYKH